ncbi:MFS transporter [Veronia nyctiphanis]|nr:MFS transporter [Veronia nyctiphanis]
MFLMLPILPAWLMSWGLSPAEMAIGYVTMGAMVIVLEVPCGMLADKFGRLTLYMSGVVFFTAAMSIMLLSPNLVGAVAGFACWGTALAMNSGTLQAWFVEAFRTKGGEEELQPGFAVVSKYASLIAATFSLLGAVVTAVWAFVPAWSMPLDTVVVGALGSMLLHGVFTFFWLKGKTHSNQQTQQQTSTAAPKQPSESIIALCRNPVIWRLLALAVLITPLFSAVEKFWPALFEPLLQNVWPDISLTEDVAWVFYLLFALLSFGSSVVQPLMTQLCRLLNQQLGKAIYAVYVAKCLSLFMLAISTNWWMFLISWLLFNVFMSMASSAASQLLNDRVPDKKRASMMSVQSLFTRIGGIGGSLAIGVGTLYLNINSMFMLLACFGFLAISLYLSPALNNRSEPTKEAVA